MNDFQLFDADENLKDDKILQERRIQMERSKNDRLRQAQGKKVVDRSIAECRLIHLSRNEKPVYQWSNVLTADECFRIISSTHGRKWTRNRHSRYATVDIPTFKLHDIHEWLLTVIRNRVLNRLEEIEEFGRNYLALLDLFIVKYEATAEGQSKLEIHTDGSLLSFNILLNSPKEFQGGGTFIKKYERVFQGHQGDCILHSGKDEHAGVEITKGTRIVLVGFIDTVDSKHKMNHHIQYQL